MSLIDNYGDSLKNKLFKEIEKSIIERVKMQEGGQNINSSEQLEQGKAADAFDKMMRKLSSSDENNEIDPKNSPSKMKGQQPKTGLNNQVNPSNPSLESQNNQQGYDKNEIQKKERMMEIINQQQGK